MKNTWMGLLFSLMFTTFAGHAVNIESISDVGIGDSQLNLLPLGRREQIEVTD